MNAAPSPTSTPTPDGAIPGGRPEWLPAFVPDWAVQIFLATLVLVIAWFLAQLLRKALARRVARRFNRPSLTRTVLRAIQGIVLLFGGFAALAVLGVELGDLAISLSVFSAVLGFVLAPIIGSIISGVFVLSEHAYEIGDMVEFADTGTRGFVEDITLRYTKVFTLDNTFLVIPNGTMRERDIVNYSAEDSRTRLRLQLLVTYESDVPAARELMEESASQVEKVIEGGPDIRIGAARYPASPTCYIDEYADHGVLLTLRYWVTEPYKLLTVRSAVQTEVWERIHDADVEIAYPHQHLVFDETSGEMQVATRHAEADVGRATEQGRRDVDGGATEDSP